MSSGSSDGATGGSDKLAPMTVKVRALVLDYIRARDSGVELGDITTYLNEEISKKRWRSITNPDEAIKEEDKKKIVEEVKKVVGGNKEALRTYFLADSLEDIKAFKALWPKKAPQGTDLPEGERVRTPAARTGSPTPVADAGSSVAPAASAAGGSRKGGSDTATPAAADAGAPTPTSRVRPATAAPGARPAVPVAGARSPASAARTGFPKSAASSTGLGEAADIAQPPGGSGAGSPPAAADAGAPALATGAGSRSLQVARLMALMAAAERIKGLAGGRSQTPAAGVSSPASAADAATGATRPTPAADKGTTPPAPAPTTRVSPTATRTGSPAPAADARSPVPAADSSLSGVSAASTGSAGSPTPVARTGSPAPAADAGSPVPAPSGARPPAADSSLSGVSAASTGGTGSPTPEASAGSPAPAPTKGAKTTRAQASLSESGVTAAKGALYKRIMDEAVAFYKKQDGVVAASEEVSAKDGALYGHDSLSFSSLSEEEYEKKLRQALESPIWEPYSPEKEPCEGFNKVLEDRRAKVNAAIHDEVSKSNLPLKIDGNKETITFASGAKIEATVDKEKGEVTALTPIIAGGKEPEETITLTFPRVGKDGKKIPEKFDTVEYSLNKGTGKYECTGATILTGVGSSKLSEGLIKDIHQQVSTKKEHVKAKEEVIARTSGMQAATKLASAIAGSMAHGDSASPPFRPPATPRPAGKSRSGLRAKGSGSSRA